MTLGEGSAIFRIRDAGGYQVMAEGEEFCFEYLELLSF